jgi:hypothetical protein
MWNRDRSWRLAGLIALILVTATAESAELVRSLVLPGILHPIARETASSYYSEGGGHSNANEVGLSQQRVTAARPALSCLNKDGGATDRTYILGFFLVLGLGALLIMVARR